MPDVLRPWLTPVSVSKYAGKRAAVDAYSWLHKGAYSCALELGTGDRWWARAKRDAPYVRYCVHRAQMLRHFGITPVIVFDGDRLPAKGGEEKERRDRRAEALRKGHERLAARDREGAAFFFAQGVDVSPSMAHELIAALKREGFEFIVAPYEADAQIAALAAMGGGEGGGVDVVFTEDSDLVAYGCPSVLFKLDKFGDAQELRIADVLSGPPGARARDALEETTRGGGGGGVEGGGAGWSDARAGDDDDDVEIAVTTARGRGGGGGGGRNQNGKGAPLNFTGWSMDLFLGLCVLSGCDFLPNVRGIGIKKAHALVAKHRSIHAVLAVLRGDKKIVVPDGYHENFRRAYWTFKHARVYDPKLRRLRPLNPTPPELEKEGADTSFLGPLMHDAIAVDVAEGRLDPISRKPFVVPPSPPRQRGWAPRGHAREHGSHGGYAPPAVSKPPPRPPAFANLFGGENAAKPTFVFNGGKARATGGGGGGGGGFSVRADAMNSTGDDALAAMMDQVEGGRAGGVSQNAHGATRDDRASAGASSSSWVPAAFATVAPDSTRSSAPPATGDASGAAGGHTPSARGVDGGVRPAWRPTAPSLRAGAPTNKFARAAPASKQKGSLANLFANAPKMRASAPPSHEARGDESPAANAAPAPLAPRSLNAFAKLGVKTTTTKGAGAKATIAPPAKAKKGTVMALFAKAQGGEKRSTEGDIENDAGDGEKRRRHA